MLFEKFFTRSLQLANRMVMAPLTRSRAIPQGHPRSAKLSQVWSLTKEALAV